MAVPAGPTEKRYTGNGVTTIFTIPFLLLAASDLDVFLDGAEIVSGFTITGVGNPTSTITFATPPPNLSSILLNLNVPFERLNDYQENGDFLSSTINRDFDRIWQALKQLLRRTTRAMTLGETDIDGAGNYQAKGNGIANLRDPVSDQDAVNKRWINSLIDSVSGVINTAQGIAYDGGTLFDYLRFGVSRTVDSIAGLRALSAGRNQRASVLGYYAKGDGGGGEYFADTSDVSSPDNGGTIIVGYDGVRWKLIYNQWLSLRQFGAKGDNVTDDGAAIDHWMTACLTTSTNGWIPVGNFWRSSRMAVNIGLNPGKCCPHFVGQSPYMSNIISAWNGVTPAFEFYLPVVGPVDPTTFQGKFERFSFKSNTPFVGFQFGKDDFSDNHGNYVFDQMFFANDNTSSADTAVSAKFNWVFDCDFRNCVFVGKPMYGSALWGVKMHFCNFIGGSYSNARNGVLLTGGDSFNLTFTSPDFENVKTFFYGDDPGMQHIRMTNAYVDVWDPLAMAYPSGAYPLFVGQAQAGGVVFDDIRFVRPQSFLYAYFSGIQFGVPGAINPASNFNNFIIRGRHPGQITPSIQPSDTPVTNKTGQTQQVLFTKTTAVFINAVEYTMTAGSVTLRPNDSISLRYSTTPTWSWAAQR